MVVVYINCILWSSWRIWRSG